MAGKPITHVEKVAHFTEYYVKEPNKDFDLELIDTLIGVQDEENTETKDAWLAFHPNITQTKMAQANELLDGALDTAYSALAIAYSLLRYMGHSSGDASVAVHIALHKVCDANLTKKMPDGTVLRNDKGKIMKPPGFVHPTYDDILTPIKCEDSNER